MSEGGWIVPEHRPRNLDAASPDSLNDALSEAQAIRGHLGEQNISDATFDQFWRARNYDDGIAVDVYHVGQNLSADAQADISANGVAVVQGNGWVVCRTFNINARHRAEVTVTCGLQYIGDNTEVDTGSLLLGCRLAGSLFTEGVIGGQDRAIEGPNAEHGPTGPAGSVVVEGVWTVPPGVHVVEVVGFVLGIPEVSTGVPTAYVLGGDTLVEVVYR